jgi:hypothetical protein
VKEELRVFWECEEEFDSWAPRFINVGVGAPAQLWERSSDEEDAGMRVKGLIVGGVFGDVAGLSIKPGRDEDEVRSGGGHETVGASWFVDVGCSTESFKACKGWRNGSVGHSNICLLSYVLSVCNWDEINIRCRN